MNKLLMPQEERHGFVTGVASLRHCPQEELVQRAGEHTRECALWPLY